MIKILKLVLETVLVSVVSIIVCAGIAFIQATMIYYNRETEFGVVSTYVVIPTSALVGPLSYVLFLRQWITMRRFLLFTSVYFIVCFVFLVVLEILTGAAFWFIHFSAFILLPLGYIIPEFISADQPKHAT